MAFSLASEDLSLLKGGIDHTGRSATPPVMTQHPALLGNLRISRRPSGEPPTNWLTHRYSYSRAHQLACNSRCVSRITGQFGKTHEHSLKLPARSYYTKVTRKIGFMQSGIPARPHRRVHFSAATPLANLTASSMAYTLAGAKCASAP